MKLENTNIVRITDTMVRGNPELLQTPLKNGQNGNISVFLIQDSNLIWGHVFNKTLGYRVYIKYEGSLMQNEFSAEQARLVADYISKGENNEDILNIGIVLKQTANKIDILNAAWERQGKPTIPLDKIGHPGNA